MVSKNEKFYFDSIYSQPTTQHLWRLTGVSSVNFELVSPLGLSFSGRMGQ